MGNTAIAWKALTNAFVIVKQKFDLMEFFEASPWAEYPSPHCPDWLRCGSARFDGRLIKLIQRFEIFDLCTLIKKHLRTPLLSSPNIHTNFSSQSLNQSPVSSDHFDQQIYVLAGLWVLASRPIYFILGLHSHLR